MGQSILKCWANILQSSFNPAKARVMAAKVLCRLSDSKGQLTAQQNHAWLAQNARPLEEYVRENFGDLLAETDQFCRDLEYHAQDTLSKIPHDLGGGGGAPLLYALVRHLKPTVVVETGVAAGFSSASILAAMEKNGRGHLYSSDFPYFRIENAEKYIGVVVDERLKSRWSLHIKGDRENIPAILQEIDGPIDVFHYDSDKSYDGRSFVLQQVRQRLSPDAVIIVDDIQDNAQFHDFVSADSTIKWAVFSYQGKYIGIVTPT